MRRCVSSETPKPWVDMVIGVYRRETLSNISGLSLSSPTVGWFTPDEFQVIGLCESSNLNALRSTDNTIPEIVGEVSIRETEARW